MNILLAEDDALIREGLTDLLEREGHAIIAVADGSAALAAFAAQRPDFLLLDIMMPGKSGYDVCREVRRQDQHLPVIFISARSEEIDRVLGLELGADDYIMKPFGAREVVARIDAVARRAGAASPPAAESFQMGDLQVCAAELRARRGNQSIDLSTRELRILRLLHQRQGKVVSREALFDAGWGRDYLPSSRTLDQQISRLRKLIEHDPAKPQLIHTVHGAGYRFDG